MIGQHTVWTWYFKDRPVYVGWGKTTLIHPARLVWKQRKDYDSELNDFLREQSKEPDRRGGTMPMSKKDASWTCGQVRRTYMDAGYVLLDARPRDTRKGGGLNRCVISPDHIIYNSVRRAAKAEGLNPSTITRYCQSDKSDWCYVERAPNESSL